MSTIAECFDVVDTPAESLKTTEDTVDRRQVFKDAIRKGKGIQSNL